jgi:putative salt-induced outer membrane protein YdiY
VGAPALVEFRFRPAEKPKNKTRSTIMQKTNMSQNRRHAGLAAAILLIGCGIASAQTPAPAAATPVPAEPEKKGWETSAAAGLTLTRGNSDTLLVTAGLRTERKWEKDEAAFGISGGYGEDNSTVNNEFVQGFGQYNHLFTDRFYAGLRLDAAYDGIAHLDYRVTITPLVGYYLVKNEKTTLAVEVGPSGVWEQYQDQSANSYVGIRFAERLEHKLTDSTKLWESVSYVPQIDRWAQNYIVTAEAGIDTAITKQWSLRVVLQDVYTSEPANNSVKNEMRLIAGTAYKF